MTLCRAGRSITRPSRICSDGLASSAAEFGCSLFAKRPWPLPRVFGLANHPPKRRPVAQGYQQDLPLRFRQDRVAAVVMLFLGAGTSGFQVLNLAVALRAADVAFMGRVAALTMMAMSLSSIVALPVGILADHFGDRPVLTIMGVAVLVASVVLALWRRASDQQFAAAR